jgi:hypothetical protein
MAAKLKAGDRVKNTYTNEIGTIVAVYGKNLYSVKYRGSEIPDDQNRRNIKPLLCISCIPTCM